jgi:hypothetical protein
VDTVVIRMSEFFGKKTEILIVYKKGQMLLKKKYSPLILTQIATTFSTKIQVAIQLKKITCSVYEMLPRLVGRREEEV